MGAHDFTSAQAARVGSTLVDALAAEDDGRAREAFLNALVEFATWDLVESSDLMRALELQRPDSNDSAEHWADLTDLIDLGSG